MERIIGFLGFDSFEPLLYAAHLFSAAGESVVVVNYSNDAGINQFAGLTNSQDVVYNDITFCHDTSIDLDDYADFSIVLIALKSSSAQEVLDLCSDFVFSSDLIPWREDATAELEILETQDVVFLGFADRSFQHVAEEIATKVFGFVPTICMIPFSVGNARTKVNLIAKGTFDFRLVSEDLKTALRAIASNTLTQKQLTTAFRRKWR